MTIIIIMWKKLKIYISEYTDHIESLGLNEAWLDLTASQRLFGGDPINIAKEIQMRIYQETGFVVFNGSKHLIKHLLNWVIISIMKRD